MRSAMDVTSMTLLAVGSAPWLEHVADVADEFIPADESDAGHHVSVYGPVETLDDRPTTLDDLETVDCLLTDDPSLPGAVSSPVLVGPADGVEGDQRSEEDAASETGHFERALEAGAADVLGAPTVEHPRLLARRVRGVLERSDEPSSGLESDSFVHSVLENAPGVVFVLDDAGRIRFVTPSIEHVAGYDPSTVVDSTLDSRIHEEDRASVREMVDAVRRGQLDGTATCEYKYQHADGSWRVHEAEFTGRLDGSAVGDVVVSVKDITGYRLVERELNESFDRVSDAFVALDSEGRLTYLNDEAESLLERSKLDVIGQHLLEAFPEMEGSAFEREANLAITDQEPRTVESYYEPYDQWIEARLYPSTTGLSIYFRNVSSRVERERELAERSTQLQALIENAPVILFAIDTDGVFTFSEGRALETVGLEPGEVVGESVEAVYGAHSDILEDVERALSGDPVHSFREVDGHVFETWYRPVRSDDRIDYAIGIGIDVTERHQYEQTLNTLYEATQHLLTVESNQAACEYIVDVATEVFDLPNVAVFRFDDRRNELVPAAYTNAMSSDIGPPPTFGPDSSITWETFISGETALYDDVRESPYVHVDDTPARSGLFVPLGEHGVLMALSRTAGQYTDDTVDLVQLFAATAEAALDRISRTQRLHEREQELARQNEHLERLNQASSLREDVESLLLRADARSEIEAGVCERLVDLDSCTYAWIGEPDPGGNELLDRSDAGYGQEYLDSITVTAVDDDAAEPAGRTARRIDPTYVPNVAEHLRRGGWRTEAISRSFQSAFAVPLVYDEFLYGVLAVYSNDRDGFDEPTRSTLVELGETIAYAIDAVQQKRALLGDEVTEVELEISTESPLSNLAKRIDSQVDLEGLIPQAEGSPIVFARVHDAVEESSLEPADGISAVSVLSREAGESMIQLRFHGPCLATIVDTHGGRLRAFTATPTSGTRATIEIPRSVDVRSVLSDINRRGISATMVARRERDAGRDHPLDVSRTMTETQLLSTLTDRQREVVQTAYHGGFFEWPRLTTGEELAESLDISPPAFHNHVRTATRKLYMALFDQEE